MSLIDSYRNTLQRKREEVAKLTASKAKIHKKYAECSAKAQKASEAANKSKSAATIKTKLREAERFSKNASKEAENLAKIEAKISSKQKEVDRALRQVNDLEEKQSKKQSKEQEKRFEQVKRTLSEHDRLHQSTIIELEQLTKLPEKIAIAFFAANPLDQDLLRLDEEVRSIQEMLRKSLHRDSIAFHSFWATRSIDILQSLNETNPTVVHFSGHGSDRDELVLQDNKGDTKLITKEAIVQTMVATESNIRLVLFNTCFSEGQAEAIVQHVDAAIGMSDSISDEAARVFSSQFYSSIGFGLSIALAFEQAKAALMLEGIPESETPRLFVRENKDPNSMVIVKPEGVV